MKDKIIWVCGQWHKIDTSPYYVWGIKGLYLKEKDAIKNCESWEFFVGPLILNKTYPSAISEWEGSYYPIDPPKGLKRFLEIDKKGESNE
jgi:hypothetical protein